MKIEINKIYNMDCLDGMRLMKEQGIKVDCVITDPPYNVNFTPQRKNAGQKSSRKPIIKDDLNEEEFCEFLTQAFKEVYDILNDNSFLISFMGWATIPQFNKAIKVAGFEIKSMPIWEKESFGIGYYTRPQYEPMYLCIKGKPEPPKKAISDIIKANRARKIIHSCQKPMELLYTLINTFTKEGDLILDPFMGSGTTAVACHKLNRRYIGFELDKEYYDLATKRINEEKAQITIFD